MAGLEGWPNPRGNRMEGFYCLNGIKKNTTKYWEFTLHSCASIPYLFIQIMSKISSLYQQNLITWFKYLTNIYCKVFYHHVKTKWRLQLACVNYNIFQFAFICDVVWFQVLVWTLWGSATCWRVCVLCGAPKGCAAYGGVPSAHPMHHRASRVHYRLPGCVEPAGGIPCLCCTAWPHGGPQYTKVVAQCIVIHVTSEHLYIQYTYISCLK